MSITGTVGRRNAGEEQQRNRCQQRGTFDHLTILSLAIVMVSESKPVAAHHNVASTSGCAEYSRS
jgi:hypothetical protein